MSRRLDGIDWQALRERLNDDGFAVIEPFLDEAECRAVRELYSDPGTAFRSTIDMARFNFGSGQYRYFDYPLPPSVAELRETFYAELAPVANEWASRLGNDPCWPATLSELSERCHAAGQPRPTPLLLRYRAGDYNCLHQDLYGPIHFPLQVVVMLSREGDEYEGGDLVLVEQRPRMQSRPRVIRLRQGAAAIIPVRERPRQGARGYHRAQWRHGVGDVLQGERLTLGLIFHDAA